MKALAMLIQIWIFLGKKGNLETSEQPWSLLGLGMVLAHVKAYVGAKFSQRSFIVDAARKLFKKDTEYSSETHQYLM